MKATDLPGCPPAITELLHLMPLAPLGPGKPRREVRDKLEVVEATFGPGADRDLTAACRAGLWLAFDFLDEAHTISQELDTPEGSYWHALMHRREPDFANSAYWFRRVGRHPVFADLNREATALGYTMAAEWDPFAFGDACEQALGKGGAEEELCRQVQRVEWELLFAWCYRRAVRA
jgi:hypothetical protein